MKVAVVGAGVGGLTAAYLLNEHSEHEVHLFEAMPQAGGHANSIRIQAKSSSARDVHRGVNDSEKDITWVETAFVVFNRPTYPNFMRLLTLLGIEASDSDMSWSFSAAKPLSQSRYEWASRGLLGFFVQRSNWFRPRHWRLFWDILRFSSTAKRAIQRGDTTDKSIEEFMLRHGFGEAFREDYMIPLTAAIWSTPPDATALYFPASTHLRFMYNHHMLGLGGRHQWLTVAGSSRTYIQRILSRLSSDQQHFSTPVQSVWSSDQPLVGERQKVMLRTAAGETHEFDHVIMATHADVTLDILRRGDSTAEEEQVLSQFPFQPNNRVVMHRDERLMPQRRAAWCSWNYLSLGPEVDQAIDDKPSNNVSVTFWMNKLQNISEDKFGLIFGTLNPPMEPRPETVLGEYVYAHPQVTLQSRAAQESLPQIQNRRGITFVGAWSGYGFHEDGVTAAMRVVSEHLQVILPFDVQVYEKPLPEGRWHAVEVTLFDLAELLRRYSLVVIALILVLLHAQHWT